MKERVQLKDQGADARITINWTGMDGLRRSRQNSSGSSNGPETGSREHSEVS